MSLKYKSSYLIKYNDELISNDDLKEKAKYFSKIYLLMVNL